MRRLADDSHSHLTFWIIKMTVHQVALPNDGRQLIEEVVGKQTTRATPRCSHTTHTYTPVFLPSNETLT